MVALSKTSDFKFECDNENLEKEVFQDSKENRDHQDLSVDTAKTHPGVEVKVDGDGCLWLTLNKEVYALLQKVTHFALHTFLLHKVM
ncbi:hypothetical protein J6590_071901 [Homalodisca vitripennis]|nr:hypothetical protein J6590_071901 [Homalodisca vitripennis]